LRIGINAIFLVVGEGGGIERYLRNLIKALQRIDRENEYTIFSNKNNTGTFDLQDNFREHLCPVSARFRPMKILWEQLILPFQVNRAGIDLLFSPGNISPLFVSCPSVVVIHDLVPFIFPDDFARAERYPLRVLLHSTAKRATKIITVSRSSQRQILAQFNIPSEKTTVIYAACDEDFLSCQASIQNEKEVKEKYGINGDFILCADSARPHKNVHRLLLAFSLLKEKHGIRHHLVITGLPGRYHQFLVKMVSDLKLGEEVIFTGYVPDNVLSILYSEATVFVYPSLYEGFGLPVLEAMACGSPVVASRATSLPEVVGDAGLLVDPLNIQEMSQGIYRLLTDGQYNLELTAKGKLRVREFSWEKTAKKVLDVLQMETQRLRPNNGSASSGTMIDRHRRADELSKDKVKKVLVIYLSGIGDTVMVLSCLRFICKNYPNAEISVLASSRNYEIVKASPYCSRLFYLDTTEGISDFIRIFIRIMKELRRIECDLVIDFEQFLRLSAIITFLSKARQRVGFRTPNQYRHWAYTETLTYDPSAHNFDNFLRLLNLLGIYDKPRELEQIYVGKEDRTVVERLIQENGISHRDLVIGIHPGSGSTGVSRRWEPAKYGAIADLLTDHRGAKIVFTGTRDEQGLVRSILSTTRNTTSCSNFAGKVTLGQLPFLIKRCRVFLSNDTGPLHIAAAMKVPVVALVGPNTPMRYGPIGEGHSIIYKSLDCSPCIVAHEGIVPNCEDNRCMQEITVEEVWKALDSALEK
jgi:lipopolysaccharide heptosyltransferase II